MPPMLAMFTIEPPRCDITVCAVRHSSSGPFTLTAKILSKASSPACCNGPNTGLVAALLTMMSMPSKCSTVRAATAWASAGFPMFATIPTTVLPSACSAFTAASTCSALRLEMATLAPARASVVAIARPMPRVPPVTMATLPSRRSRARASAFGGTNGSCIDTGNPGERGKVRQEHAGRARHPATANRYRSSLVTRPIGGATMRPFIASRCRMTRSTVRGAVAGVVSSALQTAAASGMR